MCINSLGIHMKGSKLVQLIKCYATRRGLTWILHVHAVSRVIRIINGFYIAVQKTCFHGTCHSRRKLRLT